ncbi:MAG: hypothetical protein KatS3mg032_0786 [Cyclobacteriaceae bacterium]|nr:MAG: hypothetical protein KatS3mg032_0786 [Cyclobacteriaceae bacterium]
MIGFELTINNVKKSASLNNGIISIILNRVKLPERDEIDIRFTGLDMNTQERIDWLTANITKNDKVIIEIKDIEENSTPQSIKKQDEENLILDGKLRAYKALKKELEIKGLI